MIRTGVRSCVLGLGLAVVVAWAAAFLTPVSVGPPFGYLKRLEPCSVDGCQWRCRRIRGLANCAVHFYSTCSINITGHAGANAYTPSVKSIAPRWAIRPEVRRCRHSLRTPDGALPDGLDAEARSTQTAYLLVDAYGFPLPILAVTRTPASRIATGSGLRSQSLLGYAHPDTRWPPPSAETPPPFVPPLRPILSGVVVDTAFFGAIVALPGFVRVIRRSLRRQCLRCGHPLIEVTTCTECGRA